MSDRDLEKFFPHESRLNQPSFSEKGELQLAKSKSGLIACFQNEISPLVRVLQLIVKRLMVLL